jgi:hypothetical protein
LSPRARTTFTKRQKEQARQEKHKAKAERKRQRKLESQSGVAQPGDGELLQEQLGQDGSAVSEGEDGPAVFEDKSNA